MGPAWKKLLMAAGVDPVELGSTGVGNVGRANPLSAAKDCPPASLEELGMMRARHHQDRQPRIVDF